MIRADFFVYDRILDSTAIPTEMVTLIIKGNNVKFLEATNETINSLADLYGRPLLCLESDMKQYYIILKNNKFLHLDVTEEKIIHLCKMYETIKNMDSLKLIMTFAAI